MALFINGIKKGGFTEGIAPYENIRVYASDKFYPATNAILSKMTLKETK